MIIEIVKNALPAAVAAAALCVHASRTVLPNGAVMTPNDEVLRRQPVATDVSSLYARPSGGIPDSDLSAGVRGSLGRADTALQEHQSLGPVTNYADSLFGQISGRVDGVSAYTGVLESQKRNKRDLSAGWAWATDDPDCPPALAAALNALGVVPNPVEIAGTGNWSWGVGEILTNGVFAYKGFDTTAPIDAASVTIDFSDRKSDHTGRFYATARRIDALALRGDVSAATNGLRSVDGSARPLPRYLHALDFDDCYPDDAAWYYAQPQDYGSCSAVRDGGFMYRNYDWKFDDAAEFVVRMSAGPGRFASLGVANVGTNLTESFVTSGKPSRYYKCLPGRVVDGINENGVVCEINVVDTDVDPSQWSGDGDIHPLAAVRWALDNGKSAEDAATNLAARISFPSGWTQNFHWMLADERETWIVENGKASNVVGRAVMTNFQTDPVTYGAGWERFMLLQDAGANVTNAWFTRAYAPDTEWISEFGDESLMADAKRLWSQKPREAHRGETYRGRTWWQTVHTSIYDIANRVLRVAVQETDDWYVFAVPSAGGVKPEAVREIVEPMIGAATNGVIKQTSLFGGKIYLSDPAADVDGYYTAIQLTPGATYMTWKLPQYSGMVEATFAGLHDLDAGLSATNDYLRLSGGMLTGDVGFGFKRGLGHAFVFRGGDDDVERRVFVDDAGRLRLPYPYLSGIVYMDNPENLFFINGLDRSLDDHIDRLSSYTFNRKITDTTFVDYANASQGIILTNSENGIMRTVLGVPDKYTKIDGRTVQLGASETYVSHILRALGMSYFQSADSVIFRDRNINLIELIESYLHADANSGLSVTDPSYSFANLSRTATLSAPHIPTEDNPVVTPQGTLTYDGTNYWLNGETQYDRDIDGDVKASVTLDQQMLTNVVTAVKSYHYDKTLGVTWKMVPDDGHIYLIAVTNANVVTQ